MADIDTSSKNSPKKSRGFKKGKKLSTRVDLTPMVDLGFLLITFFMFTTTMSQPTAMHLNMPDDNNTTTMNTPESGTLTILLGKNNHIYYYDGILKPDFSNVAVANYKDIRQVLLNKKATTDTSKFFIIVMPGNQSTYKNIIDILNEFSINDINRYALVNKVDPRYGKIIDQFDAKIVK